MDKSPTPNTPVIVTFDRHNRNWQDGEGYNYLFLQSQNRYLNDKLKAQGHLFLNEVFDTLGFSRTSKGALEGWISPGYIEFVMERYEGGDIAIGLTPDGVIYDKIEG